MCGHVHGGRPIMTGAPADRRHLVHAAAVLLLALVIAGLAVQPTWQIGRASW